MRVFLRDVKAALSTVSCQCFYRFVLHVSGAESWKVRTVFMQLFNKVVNKLPFDDLTGEFIVTLNCFPFLYRYKLLLKMRIHQCVTAQREFEYICCQMR